MELVKEGNPNCSHEKWEYCNGGTCDGLHEKCSNCDREYCYYEN